MSPHITCPHTTVWRAWYSSHRPLMGLKYTSQFDPSSACQTYTPYQAPADATNIATNP